MDPGNYLLAFSRLAPVQIATHGHASTTGIPTIDYFVSYKPFEMFSPEASKYYSEALVTFSDFSFYYHPDVHKPDKNMTRARVCEVIGLKDCQQHIYTCPQTMHSLTWQYKITPEFDVVFRDILIADPNGVLVFKEFVNKPRLNSMLLERLKVSMPTVFDRIIVAPFLEDHEWFGLLEFADVVLDSYPFGGYTTSLQALALGTPVVTLPHPFLLAGRCTIAFLNIVGLNELVAHTPEVYVKIASDLGSDDARRAKIRQHILKNKHLLFHRTTTNPEWALFLEEAALNRPITNLHATSVQAWLRQNPQPE